MARPTALLLLAMLMSSAVIGLAEAASKKKERDDALAANKKKPAKALDSTNGPGKSKREDLTRCLNLAATNTGKVAAGFCCRSTKDR